MIKFIEVDIANTDAKTLINVSQIVSVSNYKEGFGCVCFNSASPAGEIYIVTKQSYEELKQMIRDLIKC